MSQTFKNILATLSMVLTLGASLFCLSILPAAGFFAEEDSFLIPILFAMITLGPISLFFYMKYFKSQKYLFFYLTIFTFLADLILFALGYLTK